MLGDGGDVSPAAERLLIFVSLEGRAQVVLVRHGQRNGQRGRVSVVGVRGAAGLGQRRAEADAHSYGKTLAFVLSDIFCGLKKRINFVHGGHDPRQPKRPTEPGAGHLLARAAPPAPRCAPPPAPSHPSSAPPTAEADSRDSHARYQNKHTHSHAVGAGTHTRAAGPHLKTKEFRIRFFEKEALSNLGSDCGFLILIVFRFKFVFEYMFRFFVLKIFRLKNK